MAALAVAAGLLLSLASLTGCSRKESGSSSDSGGRGHRNTAEVQSVANGGKQLYQCSMHPNIISDHPGQCPICAMDLQPVSRVKAPGIPGRGAVQLSSLQEQLINIRVTSVVSAQATKTVRAVGIIAYDETKVAIVNSRVMGWADQLFVDRPGQLVTAGQPLLALYSPDLYSAQQEYLLAFQQRQQMEKDDPQAAGNPLRKFPERNRQGAESLLQAARKRLELWDVNAAQIKALERSGHPSDTLVLTAPVSGFVVKKNVYLKQMIQAGMVLYRIADLSTVWLEADVYEYELPFVKVGQSAAVTVDAYPDQTFVGKVDFIYPYLQNTTRTARVRLVFDNPEYRLKPQMYGNAILAQDLGEQLLVPASAVFDTGKRQYVFVQKNAGMFVPTEIQLGPKTDDRFVVSQGVKAGDKVVVDGNFLLDSESQLKAAAAGSAEESGALEASGPHHSPVVAPLPAAAKDLYAPLVVEYLQAAKLLADDKTDGLPALAQKMTGEVRRILESSLQPEKEAAPYRRQLEALKEKLGMLDTNDLQNARIAFGRVSAEFIALVSHFPPPLEKPLTIVFCPMWKRSPARWMQVGQEIQNPFMGQKMPGCGQIENPVRGDP